MSLTIKIQSSQGGDTFETNADSSMTIGELKAALEPRAGVPPDRQRLIFRGRILGNEQTLTSCGIENNNTVFLVKSSAQRTGEPARPAAPAAAAAPQANPFASRGGGGMGGGGMSPEFMRTMMQNPAFRSVMENPDLIRSIMSTNPQMQALLRANPQLEQVLSDPETLRQAMRMITDPNGAQDILRSHDRAMANIEAMPGGFNALTRMFEETILPMDEAMAQGREAARSPPARSPVQPPVAQGGPMPNPWAQQPAATQQQQQQQHAAHPPLDLAGLFGAMPPGMPPTGGGLGMPPGMPPGFANILSNPELLARAMEPQNQQAIMQLHQSIATLRAAGLLPADMFPAMPFMPPGLTPPANAAAAPTQPPEVRFADQLTQLEGMGFTDRAANLRALTASQGNVNAAVERLLSGGGM